MGEAQQRWHEKQQLLKREMNIFKATHPQEFAAMLAKAVQKEQEEERVRIALEQEHVRQCLARDAATRQLRAQQQHLNTALIPAKLPIIHGLDKLQGRIALRQWNVDNNGELTSTAYGTYWKSVMIADRVPAANNQHGLYCIPITADSLTACGGRLSKYCGIIEIRGHCEVHEAENIVRAEWARILSIYVLDDSVDIYTSLPLLMENYPHTPIHVTTKTQISKYLLRIAMWQETGDATLLYR